MSEVRLCFVCFSFFGLFARRSARVLLYCSLCIPFRAVLSRPRFEWGLLAKMARPRTTFDRRSQWRRKRREKRNRRGLDSASLVLSCLLSCPLNLAVSVPYRLVTLHTRGSGAGERNQTHSDSGANVTAPGKATCLTMRFPSPARLLDPFLSSLSILDESKPYDNELC